jgi:hypothetical protein
MSSIAIGVFIGLRMDEREEEKIGRKEYEENDVKSNHEYSI